METMIANVNLPAMCILLCTLVATGIADITSSATTQTPPQQVEPLPEGYVAYSDIEVAYRVHDEFVNRTEAKSRCIRDGGRLALIDSIKKLEYVRSQKESSEFASVGIIRMHDTWVDENTGEELEALPWLSGEPSGDYDCVIMKFTNLGLFNYDCEYSYHYVCEIPIIVSPKNTVTVG